MRFIIGCVLILGAGAFAPGQEEKPPAPLLRMAGHRAQVNWLTFSADGKKAVSAGGAEAVLFGRKTCFDCTARVWDLQSGRLIATLNGHQQPLTFAQLAPDGNRLLTCAKDNTRLWELPSGRELAQFPGTLARLSPDARLVAAASPDGAIRLFDAASGEQVQQCVGHPDGILAISFAPGGKTLATAGVGLRVRIWDTTTGKALRTFSTGATTACLEFLDEHRVLAASLDGNVQVFNADGGKSPAPLRLDLGELDAIELRITDGILYTLSPGAAIRAWDPASGKPTAASRLPNVAAVHFAVQPGARQLLVATQLTTDLLLFAPPQSQ